MRACVRVHMCVQLCMSRCVCVCVWVCLASAAFLWKKCFVYVLLTLWFCLYCPFFFSHFSVISSQSVHCVEISVVCMCLCVFVSFFLCQNIRGAKP